MNSISAINVQNYKNQLHRNSQPKSPMLNAGVNDTFVSSAPSFKGIGKLNPKQEMGLFKSTLAAILAFLGFKTVKEAGMKPEAETAKPLVAENVENPVTETAGNPAENDLQKAIEINQDLANYLNRCRREHVKLISGNPYNDTDEYATTPVHTYNPHMILRIVEENERDPQFASSLAEFLGSLFDNDSALDASEEDTDCIINAFREFHNDAETLEKFTKENYAYTAERIRLYNQDPEFMLKCVNKYISNDIAKKLLEIKQQAPEAASAAVDIDSPNISENCIVEIIPLIQEKEQSVRVVANFVKNLKLDIFSKRFDTEKMTALVNLYEENPEKFAESFCYVKEGNPTDLKAVMNIDLNDQEMLKYLNDDRHYSPHWNNDYFNASNVEHAITAKKYGPVLTSITENTNTPYERAQLRKKVIEELGKDLDEVMPRIIADGREGISNTYDELKLLINLYKRYPDIKITDRMVEFNKDELKRHFDLSKL